MKDEICNKIKNMIENILRRDCRDFNEVITCDMRLREDIGLDSIDLVVLQIEVEDQWNIRFDPIKDDFQKIFYSIDTICEFLELRCNKDNGKGQE